MFPLSKINNPILPSLKLSYSVGPSSPKIGIRKFNNSSKSYDLLFDSKIDVEPSGNVWSVTIDNNNNYLIVGTSSSPFLNGYLSKNINTTFKLTPMNSPSQSPDGIVYGVDISKSRTLLATANAIGTHGVNIYSLPSLTHITSFEGTLCSDIRFNPNDTLLAIATFNDSPKIYNVNNWTIAKTLTITGLATGCDWSTDGRYVAFATSTGEGVEVFDSHNDYSKVTLSGGLPSGNYYGVDFSKDGKYLAVAGYGTQRIYIYDATTFTQISTGLSNPTSRVRRCKFSSNSRYLIVACDNGFPYSQVYNTNDWSINGQVHINSSYDAILN